MYKISIFIISFLIFINVISFEYFQDDLIVFTNNKFVTQGFDGIIDIIFTPRCFGYEEWNDGTFRPVALILNAIEYEFFGLNSSVSHFINLFLYSIVCVLFFSLSNFFLKNRTSAFLISIFFACMPVHAEIISNIKCRDEILALIFILLSLNRFLKIQKIDLLILLTSTLAFFSKESSVILICLLFIFSENKRKVFFDFIILGSYFLLLIYIHRIIVNSYDNINVISNFEDNLLINKSFLERIPNVLNNLDLSLRLLFIGDTVRYDYSYPVIKFLDSIKILSYLNLIFISFLLFLKRTRILTIAFLITWMFISNCFFLIGTIFAERLLLLPSVFIALIIYYLFTNIKYKNIIFISLIIYSFINLQIVLPAWKNLENKYKFAKSLSQIGVKDLTYLGKYEFDRGNYSEAAKYFKERLFLNPKVDIIGIDLLNCYLALNQLSQGIKDFNSLMNLNPNTTYLFAMGVLNERLGNSVKGKEYIIQAVKGDPRMLDIYQKNLYPSDKK